MLRLIGELIRKDLRIYIADRRSVVISLAIPVILACFVGYLMSRGSSGEPKRVPLIIVDQDKSPFSEDLLEKLQKNDAVEIMVMNEASAAKKVRNGDAPLAVVIPYDFGENAASAMLKHAKAPSYRLLADPTKAIQVGMAEGTLMRTTMQVLPEALFGAMAPTDQKPPFDVKTEYQSSEQSPGTSMAAHAFAGMGIQGLLFWAIESAMSILTERKQGIWRRLRASPVSPWMFIIGKTLSSTIRCCFILTFVFTVGILLFHFSVRPDWHCYLGFGMIGISVSLMTSSFAVFVASLGKNVQQSRGLSTLAVLGMSMLGGAWFPMDFLPQFMQKLSKVIPVAWAINGFDDMIWRGGGLKEAALSVVVLIGFSLAFAGIAVRRISWDPEAG